MDQRSGRYRTEGLDSGLLITSERLLDLHPDWVEIPPQHLVMVTEDGRVETSAIRLRPVRDPAGLTA